MVERDNPTIAENSRFETTSHFRLKCFRLKGASLDTTRLRCGRTRFGKLGAPRVQGERSVKLELPTRIF